MRTSRGILDQRDTYTLGLKSKNPSGKIGLGECSPLKGLSVDDSLDFTEKLNEVCHLMNTGTRTSDLDLSDWPSIRFGLEAALMDLNNGGKRLIFETDFTNGKQNIPINGLIVMSDKEDMLHRVVKKIQSGFDCIKIKVGGLDFELECELLKEIREKFLPERIQIRLDANGAFELESAMHKISRLAEFGIHSIEQPIKPGQLEAMAEICKKSSVPIALDEELIGINDRFDKETLLETIKPQYIVLKPTLIGGLKASMEWINIANTLNIGFWITSALESNIGLNIISQWCSTLAIRMYQGLGTGQLFAANFPSLIRIVHGHLNYLPDHNWQPLETLSDLKLREFS